MSAIITSTPPHLFIITCYYINFFVARTKTLNSNDRLGLLNMFPYLVSRKSKTTRLTPFYIALDINNLPPNTLLILPAQYYKILIYLFLLIKRLCYSFKLRETRLTN